MTAQYLSILYVSLKPAVNEDLFATNDFIKGGDLFKQPLILVTKGLPQMMSLTPLGGYVSLLSSFGLPLGASN